MAGPRVVLHVGAPKSGTTFLQRSLWNRKDELAAVGVRCVGEHSRDMFHAAIGIRGSEKFWKMDPAELRRTWEKLVEQARQGSGTWVMSHEILAASSRKRAEKALADLDGLDVQLVYTARDLGRQVPSDWQERVKNGSTVSFREFQDDIAQRMVTGQASGAFWRAQDVVDVIDRWVSSLRPEQVHVVTVPRRGVAERRGEVLWHRFCEAFGIDPAWAPVDSERANRSLGMAETQLLRRLNRGVERTARQQGQYDDLIRDLLMEDQLGGRESGLVRLPPELFGWAEEASWRW